MLKKNVNLEDVPAAPAINPNLVSQLRKEDMKQAVVERFSRHIDMPAPQTAGRSKKRSPYWRPADEEC